MPLIAKHLQRTSHTLTVFSTTCSRHLLSLCISLVSTPLQQPFVKMQYAEQPTPPFNSPYQTHASRSDSLLEPPYLSPSRHETMSKYPHGLGLYNYHHQIPTTLPPSPSPSESWSGHVSSSASPLMTQAIADPWASGAYEHPIIRSPQPWNASHLSPRSSVSSVAMVPGYSHAGSETSYHNISHSMGAVRLDGHAWTHDARYAHDGPTLPSTHHHPSLTVAPERLSSSMLPYDNAYGSTQMSRLEPTPAPETEDLVYGRASRESRSASRADFPQVSLHRQRPRTRRQTEPSTAAFQCHLCGKGFARSYNHKQHLQTHDDNRLKSHVCEYQDCQRRFVRATDLKRHCLSVHVKSRDHHCRNCTAKFARKDTCQR